MQQIIPALLNTTFLVMYLGYRNALAGGASDTALSQEPCSGSCQPMTSALLAIGYI